MISRRGILAAPLPVLIGCRSTSPLATPPNGETLDARGELRRIALNNKIDGAWLHVRFGDRVVASETIRGGYSGDDIEIQCISKSITGIAVALLIQDRAITLESRVGDLLAKLYKAQGRPMNDAFRGIEIRQLLSHTAGLRANGGKDREGRITTHAANQEDHSRDYISVSDILRAMRSDHSFFDAIASSDLDIPGRSGKFVYSHASYILLAMVVEAVSQTDYQRFVTERIFRPLGLPAPRAMAGPLSVGVPAWGWIMPQESLIRVWDAAFNKRKALLLSPETIDRTLLADLGAPLSRDGKMRYTLGVEVLRGDDPTHYLVMDDGEKYAASTEWEEGMVNYIEAFYPDLVWMISTPTPLTRERAARLIHETREAVVRLVRTS